jgi:hypothetical protein
MCEDEFESALEEDEAPEELREFIDERHFYVWCVNSQNQSEYLMEGLQAFELNGLTGKLIELERNNGRKSKK